MLDLLDFFAGQVESRESGLLSRTSGYSSSKFSSSSFRTSKAYGGSSTVSINAFATSTNSADHTSKSKGCLICRAKEHLLPKECDKYM